MHVSLTSIPSRFDGLGDTVESILLQNNAPASVIIYLPRRYERFGELYGLPRLPKDRRLDVRVVEDDLGPLTKVGYAVSELSPDHDLVFCDDDQIYPSDWLTRFSSERSRRPNDPLCLSGFHLESGVGQVKVTPRAVFKGAPYRLARVATLGLHKPEGPWTRSGYVDIAEGWAGVCLRPGWLPSNFTQILESCRYVDDVWISGMLAVTGRSPWLIAPGLSWANGTANTDRAALRDLIVGGEGRPELNRVAVDSMRAYFGVWK